MLFVIFFLLSTVIHAPCTEESTISDEPTSLFTIVEPACVQGWRPSSFKIPTIAQKLGPLITCSRPIFIPMEQLKQPISIHFEGLDWNIEITKSMLCQKERGYVGLKINHVANEEHNNHKVTGVLEVSLESLPQQDQANVIIGQDSVPEWASVMQHVFIGNTYQSCVRLVSRRQFRKASKLPRVYLKLRFFYGQHTGNVEYTCLRYLDETTRLNSTKVADRYESRNVKKRVQFSERTCMLGLHLQNVEIQTRDFVLRSPRYNIVSMDEGSFAFHTSGQELILYKSSIRSIAAPNGILWNKDPTDLLLNQIPVLKDYYLDTDTLPFRILLKLMCIAALRLAKTRVTSGSGSLIRHFLDSLGIFYPNIRMSSLPLLNPQPGSLTIQPFHPFQKGDPIMIDRHGSPLLTAKWDGVIIQTLNNVSTPVALCLIFRNTNSIPKPWRVLLELLLLKDAVPLVHGRLYPSMLVEIVDNYQIYLIN